MKNNFYLIMFLCCLSSSFIFNKLFAQSAYLPMAIENATWIMGGYGDFHYDAWSYRIEGDTILDGHSYKKLYYYQLEVVKNNFDFVNYKVDTFYLYGAMRDDTLNRAVYLKVIGEHPSRFGLAGDCRNVSDSTGMEIMLYDFSKTVGDTITDCMLNDHWSDDVVITSDTREVIHNNFRRVMKFGDMNDNSLHDLIEGVGHGYGLMHTISTWIHAAKGVYLASYCIGSQWDCNLLTASKESAESSTIKLYPIPAEDILNIESELSFINITLKDATGRIVISAKSIPLKSGAIDISNIEPGIYYLELIDAAQRRLVKKIIKV